MKKYECLLTKTPTGGKTEWDPAKPDGFTIGDEITFGSREGVWSIHFSSSPFDSVPVSRAFGGKANEKEMAVIVRRGTFDCECGLNVAGKSILDWNTPGGTGDQVPVTKPPDPER